MRVGLPAALAAIALATTANAGAATRWSVPLPAAAALALTTGDFTRAAAPKASQGSSAGLSSFYRTFADPDLDGRQLLVVVSEVDLYPTASAAGTDLSTLEDELSVQSSRVAWEKQFGKQFVRSVSLGGGRTRPKLLKTVVGVPVLLADGSGFQVPLIMTTNHGLLRGGLVFSAVDRSVLGVEAVAPLRSPFDPAGLLDALGVVRARALAAFTLAATAPPTITGVPAVGQTLTLDEGAWTGAPSTFTYVWLRCDQSSTCTPIAGATKRSYTVTAADSGYALRVAVTGANAVSSLKSTSAPTATVQ